ncbi:MAG: phosphotransferase [Micrococcaceae bacterium]
MKRKALELAALASAAVPELYPAGVRETQDYDEDFDSAFLIDNRGNQWIVRTPRRNEAGTQLDSEYGALQIFTPTLRSALPFKVPTMIGRIASSGTGQAAVYTHLAGDAVNITDAEVPEEYALSLGGSISAIHNLNTGLVEESGLPYYSAEDCRVRRRVELEQATSTGKVPERLLQRWQNALNDDSLWTFQPTVVHGKLNEENILALNNRVHAIQNWAHLHVGDPAEDLSWIVATNNGPLFKTVLSAYTARLKKPADKKLLIRSEMNAEFALAQWLLHGYAIEDPETIREATTLLRDLDQHIATRERLKEEARIRAEQEKRRIEEEKRRRAEAARLEAERRKQEAERRRIEAEQARVEAERRKAEEEKRRRAEEQARVAEEKERKRQASLIKVEAATDSDSNDEFKNYEDDSEIKAREAQAARTETIKNVSTVDNIRKDAAKKIQETGSIVPAPVERATSLKQESSAAITSERTVIDPPTRPVEIQKAPINEPEPTTMLQATVKPSPVVKEITEEEPVVKTKKIDDDYEFFQQSGTSEVPLLTPSNSATKVTTKTDGPVMPPAPPEPRRVVPETVATAPNSRVKGVFATSDEAATQLNQQVQQEPKADTGLIRIINDTRTVLGVQKPQNTPKTSRMPQTALAVEKTVTTEDNSKGFKSRLTGLTKKVSEKLDPNATAKITFEEPNSATPENKALQPTTPRPAQELKTTAPTPQKSSKEVESPLPTVKKVAPAQQRPVAPQRPTTPPRAAVPQNKAVSPVPQKPAPRPPQAPPAQHTTQTPQAGAPTKRRIVRRPATPLNTQGMPKLESQNKVPAIPKPTKPPVKPTKPPVVEAKKATPTKAKRVVKGKASHVEIETVASPSATAEETNKKSDTTGQSWVPAQGKSSAPAGYPVKGNENSMLFHLPGTKWYEETVPERYYTTAEAALKDGFKPAGGKRQQGLS